jgi:FtsH-binding integral membrane protein
MLSLFPELLDWSFYVPFFFRIFLSCYLLTVGYHLIKKNKAENDEEGLAWTIFGTLITATGLALLFGIYTQVFGVVAFTISLLAIYFTKRRSPDATESIAFYLLFGLVSLSLLFLGAGPYAFDLPL